jgi:membrane-associated progesterone receptor component
MVGPAAMISKSPYAPGLRSCLPGIVFAGKDASRALAKSSVKPEDVRAEWEDLDDKEKGVLSDWFTFFEKRYNIVGIVA